MYRTPSENLENLLIALSKLEYRDFVGVKPELAESLIKLFKVMEAMLDLEIKSRTINRFMPPVRQPHKQNNGAW